MRKYKIIFFFADSNGKQETYDDGEPIYYDEIVEAYNGGQAIDILKSKCQQKPRIVETREVQI